MAEGVNFLGTARSYPTIKVNFVRPGKEWALLPPLQPQNQGVSSGSFAQCQKPKSRRGEVFKGGEDTSLLTKSEPICGDVPFI